MNLQSPFTNSQLRRALGYALSLIILFFLARVLAQTWNDFAATNFRFTFDGARVIVSLAMLVVARVFAVEAWRRIIIALGDALPFTFAMRVWFVSNLARYVPGNIWQVAAMMTMVNAKGVSKTNALLSQIIYTAIALSISGLLGIFFVVFQPQVLQGLVSISPSPLNNYLPALAASAFSALIVALALPQMFRLIIRVAAKISRRDLSAPPTTFARGLVPPLFSSAMWLTNGVAFYLFVSAIADLSLAQLPAFIAINAGAYWIGYLSFITPSGLGFREGALAFMLAVYFPTPIAVALSLLARLWSTAGELLGVILIWSRPARHVQAVTEKSR